MEGFPPQQENKNESFQNQKETLKEEMSRLGIAEHQDMITVREQIRAEPERLAELYAKYESIAIEEIESIKDQREYMRAQIGLLLAKALLYLEVNDSLSALEELHGALEYAQSIGDSEAEDSIKEHLKGL